MSFVPEDLPISEARDHFADVLGRATYAGQITYITKRGQRVGAVVPVEVAEEAEAAEDAYLSGLARDAEAELAAGAVTRPLSEVLTNLELDTPQTIESYPETSEAEVPFPRHLRSAPRRVRAAPPDDDNATSSGTEPNTNDSMDTGGVDARPHY